MDEASDELFAQPLTVQHATVGDVMNLDGISQDSVPLDDTASTDGLILEAEPPAEGGGGVEDEAEAVGGGGRGGEMEAAEEAAVGPRKSGDDRAASGEDGSGASMGSPKPFDVSLFGGTTPPAESAPADDFPIKAPLPGSLTPDGGRKSVGGSEEEEEEEEEEEVGEKRGMGPLAVDIQRPPSADGFESQPIGSPGGHFQLAEAAGLFAEAGRDELTAAAVVASAPSATQPSISSFFDEAGVTGEEVVVGDTDGKRFFDSFTSGGGGNEEAFPRSVSVESHCSEADASLMVSPEGTTEVNLQPLDRSEEPRASPADNPASAAGSRPSQTDENAAMSSSSPPKQTTLLELAKQGGGGESGDQTLAGPQSPTGEVTSPHLCKVQSQAEGQPVQVAFTKNDATATARPNVLEGRPRPVVSASDSQGATPDHPGSSQASPAAPRPAHSPQPQPTPFAGLGPNQDDAFAAAMSTSHSDRRHDAWLPSLATQKVLANRMLALQGSEFVDRAQLTMPGIVLEDPQGDPVKDLMCRYVGEAEASKRVALTADHVTRDEVGLKRLLDAGCLRAAVDLTGYMLTSLGQGKGQAGMPSKHTPQSLQIWLTRLALLVKLQQHSMAEVECEAFGSLDRPDLYFEYYPDLYPGRQGTMVPFSFRALHAELPSYLGKYQDSLNRLYHLLDVTRQILFNLESGMSEYGTEMELTEEDRTASVDLWKSREVRVLYSIGRCLLLMKDFNQAVSVYESLLQRDPKNSSRLLSGIGRIFLQLGDLKAAQEAYSRTESSYEDTTDVHSKSVILMNKAFMHMAMNQYPEAKTVFNSLLELDPQNFTAINNQSVCLLYMGQLKEALSLLESLVRGDPATYLDEGLLFNLCTLYELDSSRSAAKKQSLLDLVGRHRGDGFNVGCLKMV